MSTETTGQIFPLPWANLLVFLVLILAVCGVYGNSLFNGFVWDDHDIIIDNPVNRDLSNIPAIINSADSTLSGHQKNYYRPLNRFTYMLDYQLYGLNPLGYHMENIVFHLLNAFLVYLLVVRLFSGQTAAFVAALLFAIHPINAEAVNFVSGRNNLLATFFVLLSFLSYHKARSEDKIYSYCFAGFLFFLGLLCKETALMLVVVLFLYDFSSLNDLRERIRAKVVSLVPFALLTLLYLVMRTHALSASIGISPAAQGLWQRLFHHVYIIPKYVSIILLPSKLNAYYSIPKNFLADFVWLTLAWIAIILALIYLSRKKSYAINFGLLWCAVNFIPISNIVPIPSAAMAERYLYLPAIGLWIIAAYVFQAGYATIKFRKPLIIAGASVALCLAMVTINRNSVWKDDVSIFSSIVENNPDTPRWHYALGRAWKEKGDIMKARPEWEISVGLDPGYFNSFVALGNSYIASNDFNRARYYYERAVQINSDNLEALYNLSKLNEKVNRPKEALICYEAFLQKVTPQYSGLIPAVTLKVEQLRKEIAGTP
jgi:protein O-mannosyl-transferase